ncbi:MAG: DUF1569 domain-containing protein [Phycisphaerae bacterium]|jgi:hypothetical protein
MERRTLTFATYADMRGEIARLERGGYERAGQWNLGQICKHLSYYMRGSLEGYPFLLPWLVRKLFGRSLLRKVLAGGHMKTGGRTIPASVPPDAVDETACIAEAQELITRLEQHQGELHPSPIFDRLTRDEARALHLLHGAHHLSFLIPGQTN